jgi:hypothetical protein
MIPDRVFVEPNPTNDDQMNNMMSSPNAATTCRVSNVDFVLYPRIWFNNMWCNMHFALTCFLSRGDNYYHDHDDEHGLLRRATFSPFTTFALNAADIHT